MESSFKPSRYNLWHHGENGVYLYNIFTTGLLELDDTFLPLVRNVFEDPSQFDTFPEDGKRLLLENGFMVPGKVDELDMVKFRYRKSAFDNRRLVVTMIPTKACNLACNYCFEHQKTGARMSEDDCRNILKFFEYELDEIRPTGFTIFWYGGEPLLALDIIEKFQQGTAELCAKFGIKRETDPMITNGYLLDEKTAQRLKQMGIGSLQLTLDGNRDHHDRRRVLPNGSGTFRRVREAIDIARTTFPRIAVRINTNKDNLDGIREMLAADPVFREENVYVNIGPLKTYLGGSITQEQDVFCFKGPELQRVQSEVDDMFSKSTDTDSASELSSFLFKGNSCGADHYKSFVIGPGSLVYKCYEKVDPGAEVGYIREGGFVPNQNYWKWSINEPIDHEACRQCIYLPICMGGCPSIRKRLGVPNTESCGYWEEWLKIKLQKIDRANSAA